MTDEPGPYLVWDTCAIAQDQVASLVDEARANGEELSEAKAFEQACGDQTLFDFEWEQLCENLTGLMNRINPDGCRWDARVNNFGWQRRDGTKSFFKAENGQELLRAILPKTDCTFHIFDEGDQIRIRNWHHDNPTGNEYYVIEVHRLWVVRALYEVDAETDEPAYWNSDLGWVPRSQATVFKENEKKDFKLPTGLVKLTSRTDPEMTETGEWVEVEE